MRLEGHKLVAGLGWAALLLSIAALISAALVWCNADPAGLVSNLIAASGVLASVGVGLVVATSLASFVAMQTRKTQLVDELVHVIGDEVNALIAAGWKRLDDGPHFGSTEVTRAASRLTKAVGLAGTSGMRPEVVKALNRLTLQIKKLTTDSSISAEGIMEAEEAAGDMLKRLMSARFHA